MNRRNYLILDLITLLLLIAIPWIAERFGMSRDMKAAVLIIYGIVLLIAGIFIHRRNR